MDTLYILECEDNKWYVGKSADVQRRFKQHTEGKGSAWTREYAPIRIAETRPVTGPFDETNVTKELMKKYGVENVRGGAYTTIELPKETENIIRQELRAANDSCYKCGRKGHFANRCPNHVKEEVVWECSYCSREFSTEELANAHVKACSLAPKRKSEALTCHRCGRTGHWASSCYARTDADGNNISEEEVVWQCSYCSREFSTEHQAAGHEQGCKFKQIAAIAGRQKLAERKSGGGVCYRCGRTGHYANDCYAFSSAEGKYIGKPARDFRYEWSDDDSE